jgi:DNA-binding LytR/AlgR family response regulator
MKALIIEDESHARKELIRLLNASGKDIQILEEIDSVEDSIEWFRSNPEPDVVFLDIQLADGLSFEIFREIKILAPVIFTTAYDEYAIKAFELHSIDYLLKPVKPEALKKALDKLEDILHSFKGSESFLTQAQVEQLINLKTREYKSRFLVRLGDQFYHIDTEEVAYFMAEDNVVFLISNTGKRYILDFTLEELEKKLDPMIFFRLNRGFLANIKAIKKVSKYFNSRLAIELQPPSEEKVILSRIRTVEFMKWMDR